jgi:hypothetical protein
MSNKSYRPGVSGAGAIRGYAVPSVLLTAGQLQSLEHELVTPYGVSTN